MAALNTDLTQVLLQLLTYKLPLGTGGILPITFSSMATNPLFNGETINLGGTSFNGASLKLDPIDLSWRNVSLYRIPLPTLKTDPKVVEESTKEDGMKINPDLIQTGMNAMSNAFILTGAATGNLKMIGAGQIMNAAGGAFDVVRNWKSTKGLEGLALTDAKLSNASGIASAAGNMADAARNTFFADVHANDSSLTLGMNTAYDAVSSAMMGFSPIGTIVGGAMKVGALVGDGLTKMGVGTDLMTTADRILDSNFFKLTPTGLVNALGAKKTDSFSINLDTMSKVGGDYGGTNTTLQNAADKSGKKYGLFSGKSRRSANNYIANARAFQNKMTGIANDAEDRRLNAQSTALANYLRYLQNMNGGILDYALSAKEGGILNSYIDLETKQIEEVWKPVITDVTAEFKLGGVIEEPEWEPVITDIIESYKNGGTLEDEWVPNIIEYKEGGLVGESYTPLTELKNVIPDGALHKNKHHMENADGLTKKGIPVIDNNGELQAEIELNEIIFSLEVTKKLESLYKSYYHYDTSNKEKDDLAIEAGKLLVLEILFNTEDNTGLIDTLKNGGKINGNIE